MNRNARKIVIVMLIIYLFALFSVTFNPYTSHCEDPKGTCQLCLATHDLKITLSQVIIVNSVLGFLFLLLWLNKLCGFKIVYLKPQTLVSLRVRLDN